MTSIHAPYARPRVKPIYPRYREDAGVFRVGAQRGLTMEITDPHSHVWDLFDLLDGSRDTDAVVADMLRSHPELTSDDVINAIAHFDSVGILDDGSVSRYDNDQTYARYIGNVNYFSHFLKSTDQRGGYQDLLCDTRVCLLGLGGGGSTILQLLAAVGIGAILVADYDRVETTNLNRQLLFEESSIGRLKTEVAHEFLTRRNTLIDAKFDTCFIDSPITVARLIDGCDLVICAVDEPPGIVQRVVNKACVAAGIPCVYGMSQITRGRVFSVIPGESGCVDCLYLHYDATDSKWAARFGDLTSRELHIPSLAFAPNLMRVGAELVDEAVRIRTGYLPPRTVGVQLELDFEAGTSYQLTEWQWSRDPVHCPTCGQGPEEQFARRIGSPVMDDCRATT